MAKKRLKIIYIFFIILTVPVLGLFLNREFIKKCISFSNAKGNPSITVDSLLTRVKMRDYNEVDFIIKNEIVDVNSKNKNGITALFVAVDAGHLEIIELLVDKHLADTNIRSRGFTALDIAINRTSSIKRQEKLTGKQLFYINESGETIFIVNNYIEIIKYLRSKGAKTFAELESGDQKQKLPKFLVDSTVSSGNSI